MTNEFPIVVSGLGRCGTSLMMQMLEAGGLRLADGYYFEEAERLPLGREVVKLLDVRLREVKAGDVIWMERDYLEQAKSQRKLLAGLGMQTAMSDLQLSGWLRHRTEEVLESVPGLRVLRVSFERLLTSPISESARVGKFLREILNIAEMAVKVKVRGPGCAAGLEIPIGVLGRVEARIRKAMA